MHTVLRPRVLPPCCCSELSREYEVSFLQMYAAGKYGWCSVQAMVYVGVHVCFELCCMCVVATYKRLYKYIFVCPYVVLK